MNDDNIAKAAIAAAMMPEPTPEDILERLCEALEKIERGVYGVQAEIRRLKAEKLTDEIE